MHSFMKKHYEHVVNSFYYVQPSRGNRNIPRSKTMSEVKYLNLAYHKLGQPIELRLAVSDNKMSNWIRDSGVDCWISMALPNARSNGDIRGGIYCKLAGDDIYGRRLDKFKFGSNEDMLLFKMKWD